MESNNSNRQAVINAICESLTMDESLPLTEFPLKLSIGVTKLDSGYAVSIFPQALASDEEEG